MNADKVKHTLRKYLNNEFILHGENHDWGCTVIAMERNGNAVSRTYWLNDDTDHIYFDWLSVDEEHRRKGLATEMLNGHINVSEELGLNSMLWVKNESWMQQWYKRKGYVKHGNYDDSHMWHVRCAR